ncbi:MAG: saccharopine dehydrogenase NADP-binding domain-containing protein [Planctomycetes bacterium]|nr:saccharopine dehydrogenase NADP-binding domain-containing protein [Planctomycetota bacterium]
MRRIVVLGGSGFFGAAAAALLRAAGAAVTVAARGSGAGLRVDAEAPASLRSALHAGDVVLDAAGPFQSRSTALVEAALERGFDVLDISDSLDYAEALRPLAPRIAAAGIRVLNGCSSFSAISAAATRLSGLAEPVRLTAFLAPAARHAARAGVAASLLASIGRPVRIRAGGRLERRPGWLEARDFLLPEPIGAVRGRLFESADAVTLPEAWPTLADVRCFIDTRIPGLNAALAVAARFPPARWAALATWRLGLPAARLLGRGDGGLGFEVEAVGGRIRRLAFVGSDRAHLTAVAPAVLAARALAEGPVSEVGLVPADRQVDPQALVAFLATLGVEFRRLDGSPP